MSVTKNTTKNTTFPVLDISPRDAFDKANHFDSTFKTGHKYYEYNFWLAIYERIHPVHTQPGTEQRTRCMNVLKKALEWHLDNTINGDERTKIMAAQREINAYK
jgi:hypothetical protein